MSAEDDFAEFEASQRHDETKAALNRALRQIAKLKNSRAELTEAVYRAASDNFSALEIPPVPPPVSHPAGDGGEETAVSWLGDLQLGKVTPTYNSKVCEARVTKLADKVRRITDVQRTDHPVRKCHVWMLGDMIEGMTIFPGQQWLVDSSLYRQIALDGPRILSNYLRSLLADFDEVHVAAVVGNHGRLGKHGEYDPETNGDRMLYRITQQLLQSEKRLTWNIPDGMGEKHWYAIDKIGKKYAGMLFHGDQFGGKFNASLTRVAVQRKVNGWKGGAVPEKFHRVAFGHWHQLYEDNANGTPIGCNGSTECTNTFAQEALAAKSVPFQRLHFVHLESGHETAEYKIRLS
jgi:hypothetical protein